MSSLSNFSAARSDGGPSKNATEASDTVVVVCAASHPSGMTPTRCSTSIFYGQVFLAKSWAPDSAGTDARNAVARQANKGRGMVGIAGILIGYRKIGR